MGNASARLKPDNEHNQPPPDYEPDGNRVTLTIHSGGKVENGVYTDEGHATNVYKYDYIFSENIAYQSIKKSAERLYVGKEFGIWVSVGGELKVVKDDTVLKEAVDALGHEREVHIYVVENNEDDVVLADIHSFNEEGSFNFSEFSDSDEAYEYDMRDEEEIETDDGQVNVFERKGARDNDVAAVGRKRKGKQVVDVAPNSNSDEDFDDDNVNLSGDELASPMDSDEERDASLPVFNSDHLFKPVLQLGMLFSTRKELKMAIQSYAINEKRSIKFIKNDKRRLYAKCTDPNCSWILRGVPADKQLSFRIRAFVDKHTCKPRTNVDNVSSTWLANKYKEKFSNDPARDINAWRKETIAELKVHVTEHQAYGTKYKALKLIDGTLEQQYELLWSFGEEVKRSNPGSTIVIETDGSGTRNRFDRMYICLHALKEGFRSGCRPVICLDGCWLKGPYGGILLTACGVDANNSYMPIAYAMVEKENTEIWSWFLMLLKKDLKIEDTSKYTLMSDKQKGLIQAEFNEFPGAEYRFCARHLVVNFQNAGFKGSHLKRLFWKAAKCYTINSFEKAMDEIHKIDPKAAVWLRDKPPNQWCRAFFREFPCCDVLTNNACESFNSNILNARKRPILSMFQNLHTYLMSRFTKNRRMASNSKRWKDVLCPRIQEIIDGYDARIVDFVPMESDDNNFQVTSIYNCKDQYCVNLKDGVCGCRKWQLSGLPCVHAMVVLSFKCLDVEPYIHKCYEVETYKKTYKLPILPMNGSDEWPKTNHLPIVAPVATKRKPGRPTTLRRREGGEGVSKVRKKKVGRPRVLPCGSKIKRHQETVRCKKCGKTGHNSRGCKEDEMQQNVEEVPREEGLNEGVELQTEIVSMVGFPHANVSYPVQEQQIMQGPSEQACVQKVSKKRPGRPKKKTRTKENTNIVAPGVGQETMVTTNVPNMNEMEIEATVDEGMVTHNAEEASEPTFLSQMIDAPPLLSQLEQSQPSHVNLVIPAKHDSNRKHGSYADLSGPVPAIIKDGQRFMTLSNVLKTAEQNREKN